MRFRNLGVTSLVMWALFLCVNAHVHAHQDFVSVIKLAKPSVAKVEVVRKKKWLGSKKSAKRKEILGSHADFFDEDIGEYPELSTGSGFFVAPNHSSNTLILTAAHVVDKAKSISVLLANGDKLSAEVVRVDRRIDVALLKTKKSVAINGLKLSQALVQEGQPVLAISASFGLPISSSTGIVSALNVRLTKRKKLGLLQTDVAVNPGSSGGPLLNHDGAVVGLVSNIYSNTGSFSGAAFAVPAAVLQVFLDN